MPVSRIEKGNSRYDKYTYMQKIIVICNTT